MGNKDIKVDIKYIINNQESLSDKVMKTLYERMPKNIQQYAQRTHSQATMHIKYTFSFLQIAIESQDYNLFIQYVKWIRVLLASYKVPVYLVKLNFDIIIDILEQEGEVDKCISDIIENAINCTDDIYINEKYISKFNVNEELCKLYLDYLLNLDRQNACKLILDAYHKNNMSIQDIYLQVIEPVMHEVGRLWQRNLITVFQEHYCSAATQWILARLYPEIFNDYPKEHVYLGACVSKELHEMGGRMVADFFEMEGWDSHYIGANTPTSSLIKFIKSHKVDVLGLSAAIGMHIEEVKNVIEKIKNDNDCKHVKIIVGGYVFNKSPQLWEYVGADGYGKNARESYELGCRLILEKLKLNGEYI